MLNSIISLLTEFTSVMFPYVLNHVFALAFLATVPVIIRSFFRG